MANYNFPICFLDPPHILDAAVTSIPGAGEDPLQVVASTGTRSAVAIDYTDTTGDYIGVYQGPEGSEVLKCIIGGGQTARAWAVFPANSRVSLRSMTAIEITYGKLVCAFMSY